MRFHVSGLLVVSSAVSLGLVCAACGPSAEERGNGAVGGGAVAGTGGAAAGGAPGSGGTPAGTGGDGVETSPDDVSDVPAPPTTGFGKAITGGSTQSDYATINLQVGGESYNVQTNPWGGATQTITAGNGAIFTVDSITHPSGGESWDVASFPSVYKGTAQGGHPTDSSGLPILVSSIKTVYTGLKTNALTAAYDGNTTYDVYFTNSQSYSMGAPNTYLMVWFHSKSLNPINSEGEGWKCKSIAPTHIEACTGAGSVQVHGKTFHRFYGLNGSSDVISYVAETPMEEWEFDLNAFILDAVAKGYVKPEMYLQSIQGGFEIADGGAGLTIHDFYAEVL